MALRKFNDAIERQIGYISNNESVTPQQEMCCSTEEPLHLAIAKQRRKEYPYFTLVHSPEPGELNNSDAGQFAEAMRVTIMQDAHAYAQLRFKEAAQIFLAHKKQEVKKITYQQNEYYINAMWPFFGIMKLYEIHIGHVHAYRELRQKPTEDHPEGIGPSLINHEVNVLMQILEFAGRREEIKKFYHPLKCTAGRRPRVISEDKEQKFFQIISKNPDWQVGYWALSLTNNTTAFGCELRFLQLKDIDLQGELPRFWVPDENVKNEFRQGRPIALNPTAYKQMSRIVARAIKLGASKPEHYLFPLRVKRNQYDVTRPASRSFIKKSFKNMKEAAGPEYADLQPRSFRFQCVTKMAEAGIDEETIIAIAGWKNRKMLSYYARPRIEHKANALNLIDPSIKKTLPKRAEPQPAWIPKNNSFPA